MHLFWWNILSSRLLFLKGHTFPDKVNRNSEPTHIPTLTHAYAFMGEHATTNWAELCPLILCLAHGWGGHVLQSEFLAFVSCRFILGEAPSRLWHHKYTQWQQCFHDICCILLQSSSCDVSFYGAQLWPVLVAVAASSKCLSAMRSSLFLVKID